MKRNIESYQWVKLEYRAASGLILPDNKNLYSILGDIGIRLRWAKRQDMMSYFRGYSPMDSHFIWPFPSVRVSATIIPEDQYLMIEALKHGPARNWNRFPQVLSEKLDLAPQRITYPHPLQTSFD